MREPTETGYDRDAVIKAIDERILKTRSERACTCCGRLPKIHVSAISIDHDDEWVVRGVTYEEIGWAEVRYTSVTSNRSGVFPSVWIHYCPDCVPAFIKEAV